MTDTNDFSSLPNEIVVDILYRLIKTNTNLVSCYDVCSRWKDLIDRAVGFQLFIGTAWNEDDWEHPASWTQHDKIEAITLFGARKCYLSLEPLVNTLGEIPQFKQSSMLKVLSLDTPLSPFAYIQLTKPLTNLRKLELKNPTLSDLVFRDLPVDFELLEKLVLRMDTVHTHFTPNIEKVLNNVLYLMDLPEIFKQLTTLVLHVPYHYLFCKSVTDAVLKFIARHKRTLRDVDVSLDESDEGGQEPPIPIVVTTETGVITEDIRGLRLKAFALHSALPGGGKMAGLRAVMESQAELSKLISTTGFEPFTRMFQTFSSCSRTLTSVQMTISPDDVGGTGVDFRAFETCQSLRVLALLGPPKPDENPDALDQDDDIDGRMFTPDIRGTEYLPNKLEIVKIFNLFIQSADTKILLNKPVLRAVCLQNIGRRGSLGLNYSDAIELFAKQTIRSIRWAECINLNSLPSINLSEDPFSTFNAILLSHLFGQTFCVHLNEAGTSYVPGRCETGGDVMFQGSRLLDKYVFTLEAGDSDDDEDEEEEEVGVEAEEAEEAEAAEEAGEADEAEEAGEAEDNEADGQENMEVEIEEDDLFGFPDGGDGANANANEKEEGYFSEEDAGN